MSRGRRSRWSIDLADRRRRRCRRSRPISFGSTSMSSSLPASPPSAPPFWRLSNDPHRGSRPRSRSHRDWIHCELRKARRQRHGPVHGSACLDWEIAGSPQRGRTRGSANRRPLGFDERAVPGPRDQGRGTVARHGGSGSRVSKSRRARGRLETGDEGAGARTNHALFSADGQHLETRCRIQRPEPSSGDFHDQAIPRDWRADELWARSVATSIVRLPRTWTRFSKVPSPPDLPVEQPTNFRAVRNARQSLRRRGPGSPAGCRPPR